MIQSVNTAPNNIEDIEMDMEDDDFHSGKIYCANCIHCKLIPSRQMDNEHYVLRVRCAAGKWKKKLGNEKFYKYCTITRRYLDSCEAYEDMGDTQHFIRELKKTIPSKDEFYLYSYREPEMESGLSG
jgi:hypothetical protein